jgi:hypothetical protein
VTRNVGRKRQVLFARDALDVHIGLDVYLVAIFPELVKLVVYAIATAFLPRTDSGFGREVNDALHRRAAAPY